MKEKLIWRIKNGLWYVQIARYFLRTAWYTIEWGWKMGWRLGKAENVRKGRK